MASRTPIRACIRRRLTQPSGRVEAVLKPVRVRLVIRCLCWGWGGRLFQQSRHCGGGHEPIVREYREGAASCLWCSTGPWPPRPREDSLAPASPGLSSLRPDSRLCEKVLPGPAPSSASPQKRKAKDLAGEGDELWTGRLHCILIQARALPPRLRVLASTRSDGARQGRQF